MTVTPLSSPSRVALIGVSGYGSVYYGLLRRLQESGEVQLVAATVIDPVKEGAIVAELQAIGCEVFTGFHEMLGKYRGRLDLCAIPTGIPWHVPMTLAALGAGAHVLVEKPLAPTLSEVETICAAEEKERRVVMLGFQYHYAAENLELKRAVLGGVIGRLRSISVIGMWPRGADYYSRTDWAGRIRSAGGWVLDSPISNGFAHHLSLALFFAGEQVGESAVPARLSAELYRAQPIENFDTAALHIETRTGVRIHFYASHSCRATVEPELVLEGEAGRIIWTHCRGIQIEPRGKPARFIPLGDEQSARMHMFRSVLRRLGDPAVFVCGTAIAREHVRCVEAAQFAGPIREVPPEWVETNGEPGLRRDTWIRGVEESMRRAFKAERSLSETGCPWAVPPSEVSLCEGNGVLHHTQTGAPGPTKSP